MNNIPKSRKRRMQSSEEFSSILNSIFETLKEGGPKQVDPQQAPDSEIETETYYITPGSLVEFTEGGQLYRGVMLKNGQLMYFSNVTPFKMITDQDINIESIYNIPEGGTFSDKVYEYQSKVTMSIADIETKLGLTPGTLNIQK